MIWSIISYLVWISYLMIDGFREANFRHSKKKNVKVEVEILKLCNLQRLFVLSMISFFIISNIGWFGIGTITSLILITPFFLNGFYFTLRNKLDSKVYTDKFKQDIITNYDKPNLYLKFKLRRTLSIVALILQFIVCFIR